MRVTLIAESALFDSIRIVLSHGQAYMLCQLTPSFTALLLGCRDLYNFHDDYTCYNFSAVTSAVCLNDPNHKGT